MALARLSKWLCGGGEDDTDSATLTTDSRLSTDNRIKVDKVSTDNRIKVDKVSTENRIKVDKVTADGRLKVDPIKTENKLKIEKTSVDVNVNAPKKLKIEGPKAVTVKHEVDVLGPAVHTLSKPVTAVTNMFSFKKKSPDAGDPSSLM